MDLLTHTNSRIEVSKRVTVDTLSPQYVELSVVRQRVTIVHLVACAQVTTRNGYVSVVSIAM
jgi:hypothetical protein